MSAELESIAVSVPRAMKQCPGLAKDVHNAAGGRERSIRAHVVDDHVPGYVILGKAAFTMPAALSNPASSKRSVIRPNDFLIVTPLRPYHSKRRPACSPVE